MSDNKLVTPGDLRALTDKVQKAKVREQFDRADAEIPQIGDLVD